MNKLMRQDYRESRKGKCNQCGKCCEVVCLGISPKELKRVEGQKLYGDREFVSKFFINISKEKALKINPHLKTWKAIFDIDTYYYKCMLYSKKENRCRLYNYRTNMCKGFPWYDHGIKNSEPLYSVDCGYRIDIELQKLVSVIAFVGKSKKM